MGDYVPVYPELTYSATASAAITGGQVLEVSGDGTVGPAGAASTKVCGIAGHDAANGARVTVYAAGPVQEATASGAITAGDMLAAAAAGKVAAIGAGTFGQLLGVALTTAADAAKVRYVATR